ncbi:uncharacterized protein UHOD_11833 [Ustilago sp. UG-2017b]|nr:uncharacterized protein UHOD_11833 [Ustilago sp. UG-2017b]
MTTSTDNPLDISAQLFWQSTTPTSSATQTKSMPALSQSGSTSTPDIHTSCPTQASRSATGKKNFTWSGANVLHLVTILYNSESYQHALLPSRESAESDPALKLHKHPIFREISKLIFPGASVEPNHIKAKLRWLQGTYYREKKKLSLTGAGCHGPECTGSKKALGLYGRSIGVRDQADPQRSRPWPMDEEMLEKAWSECSLHGDHGLLRTHMRRRTGSISEESQAQPRRGPSSRSMQTVTIQGLER